MIAVIGCGNLNRSDDGVGPAVVAMLRERGLGGGGRGPRLLDAGTDGIAAMFGAKDCQTLIVIDACRSGSEPGAVFELPGSEVEQPHTPSLNLHDFRWNHALYAGRRIFRDRFPSDVIVLLIEAESVDFGLGMSPAVASAARIVADRVESLVRDKAGDEA